MQVMDTKVTHDGNALKVDFIGEGGEVVSVRMDDEDPKLDVQAAIDHAKVMMVQLTAFGARDSGGSVNEYDALSVGNVEDGDTVEGSDFVARSNEREGEEDGQPE
ncbi:hypothetical protein [Rhizobium sp. LjRoot258]|uniref:hypothetical protein n=1 Tax=Rhizobium sp. LjRoot258 TaxID=3342299 RepID=UPI003ECF497B